MRHFVYYRHIGRSALSELSQKPVTSDPSLMVDCPSCGAKTGFACIAQQKRRGLEATTLAPHRARKAAYSKWKDSLGQVTK